MTLQEEKLLEMETDLDDFLPRGENVEAIMVPVANASATLDSEITSVREGLHPETANNREELGKLSLSDVEYEGEKKEEVRSSVLMEYHPLTRGGTPQDILDFMTSLIDVAEENIILREIDLKATFGLTVPVGSFDDVLGDTEYGVQRIQQITSSTYAVNVRIAGTLKYQTQSQYEEAETLRTGYSDTPSDSGGSYSALYQT
jgi:hypothetical protein